MCALFGFVDTSGIISNKVKQRLINSLSISSECRGSERQVFLSLRMVI
jgi:hypothetical protein